MYISSCQLEIPYDLLTQAKRTVFVRSEILNNFSTKVPINFLRPLGLGMITVKFINSLKSDSMKFCKYAFFQIFCIIDILNMPKLNYTSNCY